MPGVPVTRADARNNIDPFFVVDRHERLQRGNGIGLGIDRADLGSSARRVAPVQGSNLGFLDAAGIRQHVGLLAGPVPPLKLYSAAALAAVAAAAFGFFKLLTMIVISGTSSIGNALFRG